MQTKKEVGTAPVRHVQYLAGLRGGPDAFNKTRFHHVDLSSDKHESALLKTKLNKAVAKHSKARKSL